MSLKQLTALSVLVFLALAPARAQSGPASDAAQSTTAQQEQRKAIEQKSLLLISALIEDSRSLRLPENRILVQATVADLLWSRDAKRARALFKEAASHLGELRGSLNNERGQEDAPLENYAELRQLLLAVLVNHEPQSARRFLLTTNLALQPEDEFNLTLDLAAQLTANDPQQSLRIAQESLSSGVSYQLVDVLTKLREKDGQAAGSLVSSIVAKLRSENLRQNGDAANVAVELLRLGARSQEAGADKGGAGSASPIAAADYGELLRMVAEAALRPPSDADLLLTLQSVMPEVERDIPSLAPQLKRRIAQLAGTSGQSSNAATIQPEAGSSPPTVESGPIITAEDRARALAAEATAAAGRGQLKHARELLDEASGLLAVRVRNYGQLEARVSVAKAYAACDPQRSFEMIEPLVEQLNRLADAMVTLDGFIARDPSARDDELLLKPLAEAVKSMSGENNGPLAALARADFDRAKALADRFQRPEVRILANLFIARSLLSTYTRAEEQAAIDEKH